MPNRPSNFSERDRLRERVFSRCHNEGCTGESGREQPASTEISPETPPLTNAELVQLRIRVIALENLLRILLAETSDRQLDPVRNYSLRVNAFPEWTTVAGSPG